ncbi:hypothetical protein SAMN05421756_105277 [Microlunatus flavus]|uniref:Uncharacterized protein n=1 Tax=Microlunatus flavus TaxID=1036181 RepID=A0A1H9IJJ1_9ACTN|nr:hypothetical protein SAMN05421756_105277 [Microlunatus flavus]
MNSDLERVMAAMREAGWRSSDEWLLSTAVKRLATARYHRECAGTSREAADYIDDELPEYRRRFIDISLRHEVRAAERSGQITRAVRDIALKLVPTWTGDPVELLIAAEAIASVDVPGERATSASSAIAAVADPPLKMAR